MSFKNLYSATQQKILILLVYLIFHSGQSTLNASDTFSTAPHEIFKHIFYYFEMEEIISLGRSSKSIFSIASKFLSEEPIVIKTKNLNNDFLLKVIQSPIPFQNITFINLPSTLISRSLILDHIIDKSIIKDITNTTLKRLALLDIKPIYFNMLTGQIPSLVATTELNIRLSYKEKIKDFELMSKMDISLLAKLTSLRKLRMGNFNIVKSNFSLSGLSVLEELVLENCNIEELTFLAKCNNLKLLDLKLNTLVKEEDDFFVLEDSIDLNSLHPLLSLTNLTKLDISDKYLTKEAFEAFTTKVTVLHKGIK